MLTPLLVLKKPTSGTTIHYVLNGTKAAGRRFDTVPLPIRGNLVPAMPYAISTTKKYTAPRLINAAVILLPHMHMHNVFKAQGRG